MTTPAPGENRADRPRRVVLLAQNETGYDNLMKLNTCLYVDKHDGGAAGDAGRARGACRTG